MKKKIILISTVVISVTVFLIFIITNSIGRTDSIQEVLDKNPNGNFEIIHEEYTDKGSILFSINVDNNKKYLSTAFVSKNIFGYKDLYSGVSSIDGLGERDLTIQYFPAIKQTSLPIYFGVILNDEIVKVNVRQSNNSEIKNAKIIDTGDIRIWLTFMEGFKGTDFEIVGYNNSEKEIYKIQDTIPWNVEQKAQKSPYE
ncbi:hypothetical protein [Clostridium sp.]|uniref:hypothetical protein n=1 Tax=Clostridium sp. TaxID=1506 RepID=UPI0029137BBC|nr:hypothetical protein [Clostridium sp.]MDU5107347.1 hypothetical protein [Clostridium sp.]